MLRLILLACLTTPAWAEVTASSATSFALGHTQTLSVPPARAWQVLTEDIHRWWNGAHSFSGNAENLSLRAEAQGCFCENWSNNSVTHLTVIQSQPHRVLRLSGGLGPLQEHPVSGVLSIRLTAVDSGTRMDWTYRVAGAVEGGLGEWAGPVDQVIGEQLQRLANYVETGKPAL